MENFKERLLSLIDNGATNAMSLFDTMNKTIDSIDWDAQFESLNTMKDSLLKKGEELMGEFNELMKQVKNNISDFEVIVPFNEAIGENMDGKVDGDKLTVEVTYEDENSSRSNKTTVKIPQNCDVEKMTQKYNKENKTMTISIPKIITEPTKEEEKGEEESHDASSKLLRRFRQTHVGSRATTTQETPTEAPKSQPRGANGRFVKRTPKAN